MIERTVDVETQDGRMSTFITHPETGGPHPVVIVYMDAPGIREELRDMARRIGTVGYYTMLPQLFYRDGGPSFPPAERRSPEQLKHMQACMARISNAMCLDDTRALMRVAEGDRAAKGGPMGCIGYCMSGQFVLSVAGTFPERFKAMVSLHGVKHVTDKPDSPHKLVPKLQGEQYFGFAETDPHVPAAEVEALRQTIEANKTKTLFEIHPGAEHGFVFADRQAYNKREAERSWERIFPLFRRQLG
jgi:carboxymethylenebutenolidase